MKRILATFLPLAMAAALAAQDTSRIALVIGNAKYTDVPELRNSVNDAKDMSAALKRMGWRVIEAYDADRRTMLKNVGNFRDALKGNPNSTALFYYAGHGVQLEGKNYLLPLDEVFEGPDDVKYGAVSLDDVLNAYSEGKALKCVTILDACRENPFDAAKTRAIGTTRGLSVVPAVEVEGGSATIFATAAGDVAQDGTGRNGIFTAALLKQIESGKSLGEIFTAVAKEVKSVTGGQQNPFINSSGLITDIYLSKAATTAVAASTGPAATAASATIQDQGKARFESSVEGSVYMGSELIGDVGPDSPLLADALPAGKQDFRFVRADGAGEETKSVNITVRAAATVVFGKAEAAKPAYGTVKVEADAEGDVFSGTVLLGSVGPGKPLVDNSMPEGLASLRFMPKGGGKEQSQDVTVKAGSVASLTFKAAAAQPAVARVEPTQSVIEPQTAEDKASQVAFLLERKALFEESLADKKRRSVAPAIVNIACWTVALGGAGLSLFSALSTNDLYDEFYSTEDTLRRAELLEQAKGMEDLFKIGYLTAGGGAVAGLGTLFLLPNTTKERKAIKELDTMIQDLSR
jgi:hypothetical protein